jgi:hypothetical protein
MSNTAQQLSDNIRKFGSESLYRLSKLHMFNTNMNEVLDKELLLIFDSLSHKSILLCPDIEMFRVNGGIDKIKYLSKNDEFNFIRELGMLVFVRIIDNNIRRWYYVGYLYCNINSYERLPEDYIKCISTRFSTTSTETNNNMKSLNDKMEKNIIDMDHVNKLLNTKQYAKLQDYFNAPIQSHYFHSKFRHRLAKIIAYDDDKVNDEITKLLLNHMERLSIFVPPKNITDPKADNIRQLIKKINDTYTADTMVQKRMVTKSIDVLELLSDVFTRATLMFKGELDLYAIHNTCVLYDVMAPTNILSFDYKFDIAMFNPLSRTLFENAKLESTFNGMVTRFPKLEEKINKIIKLNTNTIAHNPVYDAYMTIFVSCAVVKCVNDMVNN